MKFNIWLDPQQYGTNTTFPNEPYPYSGLLTSPTPSNVFRMASASCHELTKLYSFISSLWRMRSWLNEYDFSECASRHRSFECG